MADQGQGDETDRQREAGRRGEVIPGKGFDGGGGYGGAGNDNAYDAQNSYGGQSGVGGDSQRGAYAGLPYGRPGDEDAPGGSLDAGSAERGSDDDRDRGSAFDAGEGGFDADSPLGGERREPGR